METEKFYIPKTAELDSFFEYANQTEKESAIIEVAKRIDDILWWITYPSLYIFNNIVLNLSKFWVKIPYDLPEIDINLEWKWIIELIDLWKQYTDELKKNIPQLLNLDNEIERDKNLIDTFEKNKEKILYLLAYLYKISERIIPKKEKNDIKNSDWLLQWFEE